MASKLTKVDRTLIGSVSKHVELKPSASFYEDGPQRVGVIWYWNSELGRLQFKGMDGGYGHFPKHKPPHRKSFQEAHPGMEFLNDAPVRCITSKEDQKLHLGSPNKPVSIEARPIVKNKENVKVQMVHVKIVGIKYLLNDNTLPQSFFTMIEYESVRLCLKYFHMYFQVFFTIMNDLEISMRNDEPRCTFNMQLLHELDVLRKVLRKIRKLVSVQYCLIILRTDEGKAFTSKAQALVKKKISNDSFRYELLYKYITRCLRVSLGRKHEHIIEVEVGRLVRGDYLNIFHNQMVSADHPHHQRILNVISLVDPTVKIDRMKKFNVRKVGASPLAKEGMRGTAPAKLQLTKEQSDLLHRRGTYQIGILGTPLEIYDEMLRPLDSNYHENFSSGQLEKRMVIHTARPRIKSDVSAAIKKYYEMTGLRWHNA